MATISVIGKKPGQYSSRFVIVRFSDGSSSREWFSNASAQGREVNRMIAAGRVVVSLEFEGAALLMATVQTEPVPEFEDILIYVDEVLDSHWDRRDDSQWRVLWIRRLPVRADRTWAEEARIILEDQVLKLDLGDGTFVAVTNPTRSMVSHYLALFESTVAERVGAIEAAAL